MVDLFIHETETPYHNDKFKSSWKQKKIKIKKIILVPSQLLYICTHTAIPHSYYTYSVSTKPHILLFTYSLPCSNIFLHIPVATKPQIPINTSLSRSYTFYTYLLPWSYTKPCCDASSYFLHILFAMQQHIPIYSLHPAVMQLHTFHIDHCYTFPFIQHTPTHTQTSTYTDTTIIHSCTCLHILHYLTSTHSYKNQLPHSYTYLIITQLHILVPHYHTATHTSLSHIYTFLHKPVVMQLYIIIHTSLLHS
jgi:hypothetical protein